MGLHCLTSCSQVGVSVDSKKNRMRGQEHAVLQGKWIPEILQEGILLQGVIFGRGSTLPLLVFVVVCVSFGGYSQ